MAGLARANPPEGQQIEEIDRRLEAGPDVSLILQRGELRRAQGDWAGALEDYDRAASLAPGNRRIDLLRGEVYLLSGRAEAAVEALSRFIEAEPADVDGRLLRARALGALSRHAEAEADLERALAIVQANGGAPLPDLYLARADAQAAQGDEGVIRALAGLDAALAQQGPLVVLEERAVELERQRGDVDAALARLDRLIAQSRRGERYLALKGEILLGAGRREAGLAACREALAAIAALPPGKAAVPAMVALSAELRRMLGEDEGAEPGSSEPGSAPGSP